MNPWQFLGFAWQWFLVGLLVLVMLLILAALGSLVVFTTKTIVRGVGDQAKARGGVPIITSVTGPTGTTSTASSLGERKKW